MAKTVTIGSKTVGEGQPAYVIAELGINHNGEIDIAKRLIDVAVFCGADAVKFQKRTPEICTPPAQRTQTKETPWGTMPYLDYRYKLEFETDEYNQIDSYCKERDIAWFASPWDQPSVDFLEAYDPPLHKVASASITDDDLLRKLNDTGRPVMLSSGMSTMEEIRHAVSLIDSDRLLLAHSTSTYPAKAEQLNLRMINTLREEFDVPIGYSGHEVGLQASLAAVTMGATFVERHVTLDRAMWGSDQPASLEPFGLERLIRDIRVIERAMGDGVKKVYDEELPIKAKLRRVG